MLYEKIERCRICHNPNLVSILDLGTQALTGIFPRSIDEYVPEAPIELVKCHDGGKSQCCGLLQLRHTYNCQKLYSASYGYCSGLTTIMRNHLHKKARYLADMVSIRTGDIIIDIGSNDGTLLRVFPPGQFTLIGIDPVADKFKKYYPSNIQVISEFFPSISLRKIIGDKKAKLFFSIAMFYDVQSPLDFMKEIYDLLDDNGVWMLEQSYMPVMLSTTAYDTICHEHLAYYGFKQIKWLAEKAGFKVICIEFNEINGGSFSVVLAKKGSYFREDTLGINRVLQFEKRRGLDLLSTYEEFSSRVYKHREQLRQTIFGIRQAGKRIAGYGASTKGNVLLQFCCLTAEHIDYILDINEEKFGCFTPGTQIPIVPEDDTHLFESDYLLVLPWHMRQEFVRKQQKYIKSGGRLLFPFPSIEIIE